MLKHYEYQRLYPLWNLVHDCYLGTTAIKTGPNAQQYLPVSLREKRDIEENGTGNTTRYDFRKKYAIYENIFRPVIDDMVGLMQRKPARLRFGIDSDEESPKEVRELDVFGNHYKDGLKGLKGRLNFYQVLYGRYGLLLDITVDRQSHLPRFVICEFPPSRILDGEISALRINSESMIEWILLDESGIEFNRQTKMRGQNIRLRLLALNAQNEYYQRIFSGPAAFQEWQAFDFSADDSQAIYPTFRGRRLHFIPMTICNVNRLGFEQWQEPPFLDVAHIAIGIYQVDSLYKKALWNFASPTLSISNADKPNNEFYMGDAIWPQTNGSHPVTVSLLETSGSGLAEMRSAKEEMKSSLKYSSIRELLDGAGANSSSKAIELRAASGTATIVAIDQTGARAIEEQLIFASIWAGADEETAGNRISYLADTSYLNTDLSLGSITSFIEKNSTADSGNPLLSRRNIYSILEQAIPNTLSTFEDNEEQKLRQKEKEEQNPQFEESVLPPLIN